MATSSSVQTSSYDGRYLKLTVAETSTSIDNNTSTITWTLESIGGSVNYYNIYDCKVTINGSVVYGPVSPTWDSYSFPASKGSKSGTITIQHNADGSASDVSFTLRGSVRNNNPQNYDGSINLTTIPRASTFTISGGTIGSTISVSITRMSSNFTHDVYCIYNGKAQTIANGVSTSASTTLDMDYCNYITTSTSASATMYVETWNNGAYIGTKSLQFTMSVPSSVVPTISSATKTDTSNLLASYGAYVQSKSNLRVQTTASGAYSSTISSIVVNTKDSNNNIIRTLNGSDVTFNNVNYVGTATIEVIATDTRGRQATNTSTINIVSYSNPMISSFTAERLNNDSSVTFTWDASITNINNANVNNKSFKVYRRQAGTSSWGSAIFTYSSDYTYTTSSSTYSCDADYGWEFKFEAQDSFTTSTYETSIGTAFELMNWKADGTALAIGKVSEKANIFEVNLDTNFYKGIELVQATPTIDFHFNNDDTLDYTSRIIENSQGKLTFESDTYTAGNVEINGALKMGRITKGIIGTYAFFQCKGTTQSATAWTTTQVDMYASGNSTFWTNYDAGFQRNGNGIQCNFDGFIMIQRQIQHNYTSEFDIQDEFGDALFTGGRSGASTSIKQVSSGDVIDFKIITGATSFQIYNARIYIQVLQFY